MGSLKRKIQRKKNLRNIKEAKKNLRGALKASSGMPSNCSMCNKLFSPEANSDDWMVTTTSDSLMLSCPECYLKINS